MFLIENKISFEVDLLYVSSIENVIPFFAQDWRFYGGMINPPQTFKTPNLKLAHTCLPFAGKFLNGTDSHYTFVQEKLKFDF